jgi:hypoxanthine-guanine phosphoribosyltransferase
MSKLPQLLVLFFSLWLAACGGEAVDPKGEITADEKEQPTIIMPEPDMLEAGKTLYAWVDRLNIRETPDLKAKVIANVSSRTHCSLPVIQVGTSCIRFCSGA